MNQTLDLPWEDALLERKLESDQKDFLRHLLRLRIR